MSGKKAFTGSKFSSCHNCMPRGAWLWCGIVGATIGVVLLALGAVLGNAAQGALEDSITGSVVIGSTSDESFEAFVTTKRKAEFNGTDPDDEDEGLRTVYHISNVTNLEAVLTTGATPNIEDVPYEFVSYTYNRRFHS